MEEVESGKEFLSRHKTALCDEAGKLVQEVFPSKIKTLDKLCKDGRFSWDKVAQVKENAMNGEKISVNAYLEECAALLKPYMQEFMDHCFLIKTWVTLLIPKAEDGDNLGVQVQEDIVHYCADYSYNIHEYYARFPSEYEGRAKVVQKRHKYPDDTDEMFKKLIQEHDELYFIRLRFIAEKLYFNYISLYDMIVKNIDKIQKPRNDSHELCLY